MAKTNDSNEQFVPIVSFLPPEIDCFLSINNLTALPVQPTLDDAIQICVSHICKDNGWDEDAYKSHDITKKKEGVYEVILHFVLDGEDCDDGENGVIPADEWCYIFSVNNN